MDNFLHSVNTRWCTTVLKKSLEHGAPNELYCEIAVLMKKTLERVHPTSPTVKYLFWWRNICNRGTPNEFYCEISVLMKKSLEYGEAPNKPYCDIFVLVKKNFSTWGIQRAVLWNICCGEENWAPKELCCEIYVVIKKSLEQGHPASPSVPYMFWWRKV